MWAVGGCSVDSWGFSCNTKPEFSDSGCLASSEKLPTPASTAWELGPSLPATRMSFGLAALGGKLWAVGGTKAEAESKVERSVEVLTPSAAKPEWVKGPELSAARYHLGLVAFDLTLYAVAGAEDSELTSSEFLPVFASCKGTTPLRPPAPEPSPTISRLDPVYRLQGGTWVANITNADAADLGGLSCFIENNAKDWLAQYGAHAVVARYQVDAIEPDTRPVGNGTGYKDCTEQPPRTCSAFRGNPNRVGIQSTNTTGCKAPGKWYSFPGPGECVVGCERGTGGSCLGFSCYWQVLRIDKIVGFDCLQRHECNATLSGCAPSALQKAFDACPDLCTPPVPSDGCGGVPPSLLSNELDRYAFDPARCASCLEGHSTWSSTAASPENWTCGTPVKAGAIAFDAGQASNASDACYCHYTDLVPPRTPCPHGNFTSCLIACSKLPSVKIAPCDAECNRLCPHA